MNARRHGPIHYAQSGDVSIAYQMTGEGPLDLVLVPGFISHVEYDWEEPRHARFLERLASFARLIRFDKRGTGLSDRHGGIADLESRMDDVRAVIDAVGSKRVALFGYFEGGPMCVLFAATYPERTTSLVLFGTYATRVRKPDYPWGATEEWRQTRLEEIIATWGEGDSIDRFAPHVDVAMRRWWGERERIGGSPGAVRHVFASTAITDVREVLPSIRCPTLVLHRREDPMLEIAEGRYLADRIPNARFVELPGTSTLPWIDADPLLDQVEEFLTGARPNPVAERVLATTLFTDLVGSTERARELGDRAWSELMERHYDATRRELARFGGGEVDTAGDGFFALFEGPTSAIRCALAVRDSVRALGLDVRGGVHTGEVERPRGGKPRGIAVNVGARVASAASAGEVLVTATTRDLVAGSGLEFEDRGEFELKGVGETKRLYAATA